MQKSLSRTLSRRYALICILLNIACLLKCAPLLAYSVNCSSGTLCADRSIWNSVTGVDQKAVSDFGSILFLIIVVFRYAAETLRNLRINGFFIVWYFVSLLWIASNIELVWNSGAYVWDRNLITENPTLNNNSIPFPKSNRSANPSTCI
jgi:hypothetical protein